MSLEIQQIYHLAKDDDCPSVLQVFPFMDFAD